MFHCAHIYKIGYVNSVYVCIRSYMRRAMCTELIWYTIVYMNKLDISQPEKVSVNPLSFRPYLADVDRVNKSLKEMGVDRSHFFREVLHYYFSKVVTGEETSHVD